MKPRFDKSTHGDAFHYVIRCWPVELMEASIYPSNYLASASMRDNISSDDDAYGEAVEMCLRALDRAGMTLATPTD